jgi:Gp157 protein
MKKTTQAAKQTNTTLLSLMNQAMSLAQQIVEARGELTPELEKELEVSDQSLALKADAYVLVDERLEAEAAYFERKSKEFNKISKAFSKAQDKLRDRVLFVLSQSDKIEVFGTEYHWKKIKCAKRMCVDESQLPKEFLMVVSQTVPDREKIKMALGEGFEISGVTEEGGFYVRPFENSSKE